jgi:uncharacterized RmlC-like cupin family protein
VTATRVHRGREPTAHPGHLRTHTPREPHTAAALCAGAESGRPGAAGVACAMVPRLSRALAGYVGPVQAEHVETGAAGASKVCVHLCRYAATGTKCKRQHPGHMGPHHTLKCKQARTLLCQSSMPNPGALCVRCGHMQISTHTHTHTHKHTELGSVVALVMEKRL